MATRKKAGPAKKKTGSAGNKTPAGKSGPKKAAPRKTAVKKRQRPGGKKKISVSKELKKAGIGLLILVAVCLTAAMMADIFLGKKQAPETKSVQTANGGRSRPKAAAPKKLAHIEKTPPKKENHTLEPVFADISDVDTKKPQAGLKLKNGHPILYEVFEDAADTRPPKKPPRWKTADETPVIVLIIDDIGYDKKIAMSLYALDPDITFAVLPWSPYGKTIAAQLNARGAHLMLHLPMEPVQYPEVNPGKGALLSGMPPDELLGLLRENLSRVPGVKGVNNHMGSRLTAHADQMNQIFTILKKENLFFIDSLTAPDSKCRASARLLQLEFAERDIFLDNFQETAYISGQFEKLKKTALKHGSAIGIGHPYQATLDTLKAELPKIKGKIRIIPAQQVVSVPGQSG